jgi:hypothetical protein
MATTANQRSAGQVGFISFRGSPADISNIRAADMMNCTQCEIHCFMSHESTTIVLPMLGNFVHASAVSHSHNVWDRTEETTALCVCTLFVMHVFMSGLSTEKDFALSAAPRCWKLRSATAR